MPAWMIYRTYWCFLATVLTFLGCKALGDQVFIQYSAVCWSVETDPSTTKLTNISFPCVSALFSSQTNFSVMGYPVYFENDKFCEASAPRRLPSDIPQVAVIHRGLCAFDTKARVAAAEFQALIIINNDESIFPPGAQDSEFRSSVPVVLAGSSALTYLKSHPPGDPQSCNTEDCHGKHVSVSYGRAPPLPEPQRSSQSEHLSGFFWQGPWIHFATLLVAISATFIFFGYEWAVYVIIAALFVFFRLGTLRPLRIGASLEDTTYNHNETDERIFEVLVNNILKDWRDYRLSSDVIRQFRLAEENYAHSLFIHPPVFVYLSAFLYKFCQVPLPLISVVYQCGTLLLIPLLVPLLTTSVDNRDSDRLRVFGITLWSMLTFSVCPIGMLVSQKFWIDNCTMFTVTLAAYLHLLFTKHSSGALWAQFVLGLGFSLIAVQTKVTALGLLPFLALYTARILLHYYNSQWSLYVYLRIVFSWTLMVTGTVVGYSPWAYLYYTKTGRWLPSAWPSKVMIERSLYLQSIISKPWHTYFSALMVYSPVNMVGVISGGISMITGHGETSVDRVVLVSWPLSFLVAFTVLGVLGAGYQLRFLTPILPASAILAGYFVEIQLKAHKSLVSILMPVAIVMLLCYSALHCLYYGILFSPLYADMDESIVGVILNLLRTAYYSPRDKEEMQNIFRYLAHFGLNRNVH